VTTRPRAEVLEDGSVLIRATRCTLIATPLELACVIFRDLPVAARAVHRGKAHLRAQATARRTGDSGPVQTVEREALRSEPQTCSQPGPEPR
jgi:hypothetical protein